MKKTNNRKCILTNVLKPKSELIRIVKQKDGNFLINSNVQGRGAYISRSVANPDIIVKKRILNRSFRMVVPIEVYDKLVELLNKGV